MAPVVVQGTAVSPPQAVDVGYGDNQATTTAVTEHEPKKTGCKDPIFAILFYVNIIAIVVVAVTYGKDLSSSSETLNYEELIYASLVFVVASLVFSGGGLLFLLQYPSFMIKAGLILTIVLSLAWAAYAFIIGQYIMGAIGAFFFLAHSLLCKSCLESHPICCNQYGYCRDRHKSKFRFLCIRYLLQLTTSWLVGRMDGRFYWCI